MMIRRLWVGFGAKRVGTINYRFGRVSYSSTLARSLFPIPGVRIQFIVHLAQNNRKNIDFIGFWPCPRPLWVMGLILGSIAKFIGISAPRRPSSIVE